MADLTTTSLDDLIKANKKPFNPKKNSHPAKQAHGGQKPKQQHQQQQQHQQPKQHFSHRGGDLRTGLSSTQIIQRELPRLTVSNLHQGVTKDDIQELLSQFGEVTKVYLHIDQSGVSKGVAEVRFVNQDDAITALDSLNGRTLDGYPLHIDWTPVVINKPVVVAPVLVHSSPRAPKGQSFAGKSSVASAPHGGSRSSFNKGGNSSNGGHKGGFQKNGGGKGPSGGAKGGHGKPKSLEELDAELDNYKSTASTEDN